MPVKFMGLDLFFKDSTHGKCMSLEKDYRAKRVFKGKAQCRTNWKRDIAGGLRNHPSLELRGTKQKARANSVQPLQTLSWIRDECRSLLKTFITSKTLLTEEMQSKFWKLKHVLCLMDQW